MPKESMGLLQGTVDVLILKTLSAKPLHGYGISEVIHERSNGDRRGDAGSESSERDRLSAKRHVRLRKEGSARGRKVFVGRVPLGKRPL